MKLKIRNILFVFIMRLCLVHGNPDPCDEYGKSLYDTFCDPCDVTQTRFYQCVDGYNGGMMAMRQSCGIGLKCTPHSNSVVCDWPQNVAWTVEDECPTSVEVPTTPTTTEAAPPTRAQARLSGDTCAGYGKNVFDQFCDPCDVSQRTYYVCDQAPDGGVEARKMNCPDSTKCRPDGSNYIACDFPENVNWTPEDECETSDGKMIVCYFTNRAQQRTAPWNQMASDLEPDLCTHIIYAFADVTGTSISPSQQSDQSEYAAIMGLKISNPNLKVLLSVGGADSSSNVFSRLAQLTSTRTDFIANVIAFCRQYGFDGFDIDWQYPTKNGGRALDYGKFSKLIKDMRRAFNAEAGIAPRLLLSAAFSADPQIIQDSYNLAALHMNLDFMSLKAYDFTGSWDEQLGLHSPLFKSSSSANGYDCQSALTTFVAAGVPLEKIILGIPMYGQSFDLCSQSQTSIGDDSCGAGTAGTFTDQAGMLSYFEICTALQSGSWSTVYDESAQSVYSYSTKANTWISYDNERVVKRKVQYINENSLGGAMVWDLSMDDYNDVCGDGAYPLLNIIKDRLVNVLN